MVSIQLLNFAASYFILRAWKKPGGAEEPSVPWSSSFLPHPSEASSAVSRTATGSSADGRAPSGPTAASEAPCS